MKKLFFALLLCLCLGRMAGGEEAVLSLTVSQLVHPYADAGISVYAPEAGMLTLTVADDYISYQITRQQMAAGSMDIPWDGRVANGEAPGRGEYTLRAELDGAHHYTCEVSIRIGMPAAALQYCIPSADVVYAGYDGFLINYLITDSGLMHVQLFAADAPEQPLRTWGLEQSDGLPHLFNWNGQVDGRNVPAGEYILTCAIKGSAQPPFRFPITVKHEPPPQLPVSVSDPALFLPDAGDDIWSVLMAPITVVDIGRLQHQNIYAAPDQNSAVLGTLHGQTHGVIVLELGTAYARIGTWRQEDGDYVEGYVPKNKLKNVYPNPHYGLLVDKNAQTLQVWQDGALLGTLPVSTGLMAPGKLHRETLAGAFLTGDRIISFLDEGYQYNYALRIDGGNLIHSLGCRLAGGKYNYSEQLALIGSKASHGCVRVDPRPGENGLNIYWLWTHLPYGTKVLVLDDPEDRQARMAALNPTLPPTATPAPPTAAPTGAPTPAPTPEPTATPELTATPVPTATPEPAFTGTLSFRSRGLRVLQLQERLAALGYYAGDLDGAFGSQTYNAVVAFQKTNGLSADGVVGQKTYAALWSAGAIAAAVMPGTALPPTVEPMPAVSDVPTAEPAPAPTPTPTPAPTPVPTLPPETTVVISLAGDALLGSQDGMRSRPDSFDSVVARQGYAYPLRNFAPMFSQDDITFINLECVLKDDSKDKTEDRLYNFRGPTAFTAILTAASVEHVNIANNHYIDYGFSGRRTTRAALTAAGITYSGYTWTQIYEKDGVKIGFGGIRETQWKQDREKPAREIQALRAEGCDYIVYACHFGTEYEPKHNALQTEMARAILEAGADCVVGTHPHVVQGIENYGGKPIFYSLGNFVFGGNLNPEDYDGLAAQLILHFTQGRCDGVSARLIPLLTSGVQDGTTDFCPVPAQDADRERILRRIQEDSEIAIEEHIVFR